MGKEKDFRDMADEDNVHCLKRISFFDVPLRRLPISGGRDSVPIANFECHKDYDEDDLES